MNTLYKILRIYWKICKIKSVALWFSVFCGVAVIVFRIIHKESHNISVYASIITACGILAAFSINAVLNISASNNSTIEQAKQVKKGDPIFAGERISSFRQLFVRVCFTVIITFATLLIAVLIYFFQLSKFMSNHLVATMDGIMCLLLSFLVISNIKVAISLYLIYFDNTNETN